MNKQTFLTFLGGAAVGATAALLLAPRSGEETRRAIKDGVNDAVDKTRHALSHARHQAAMLPGAVSTAGSAAREAFNGHYDQDGTH